ARAVVLFGADHRWTMIALSDLGKALLGEKKAREALPVLEKALRIRERSEPIVENVAETRFALARALWDTEQDRARALALAMAGREAYAKLAWHKKEVGEIDTWLADKRTLSRETP